MLCQSLQPCCAVVIQRSPSHQVMTVRRLPDPLRRRLGLGLDAVCRLHQGCATEGFRLEKDHEGDAVLLTPKDLLALGHRVTTKQGGLELTFRDPILGEAVLGMATHGHISNVWDVSVVVLYGLFPDAPAL